MIDEHNNKEREIETTIFQGFSISLIFFLIYIGEVFNKVSETNLLVISLIFIDDLKFIALGSLVKVEIVKTLEKVGKKVIKWEKQNKVIYIILKTEVVLFSKSYQ